MDMAQMLSKTKVFNHFDDGEICALMAAGQTHKYKNNEWIVYQGDIWPYLFFVIEGDVIAVKESLEGRSLILETINIGELFWGLAFFLDDAPMPAGLRALHDCELVLWPREGLYPLLMEDGHLSWELSRLAIQRAQRASEIVDELAFQPVAGRLARFLVDRFGDRELDRVARDMTLDEMAAHIGSTREMVCRILQRFSNQGLIEITRTEFSFTDREKLKHLAQKSS
jgi:CRP-like cAMP-binding protein